MTNFDDALCSSGAAAYAELLRAEYTLRAVSGSAVEAHPTVAAAAASGDLGFSSGPWVSTAIDGSRVYGHFLSVWQRDAECNWRSAFEARVAHGAPRQIERTLSAESAAPPAGAEPPTRLIAADAVTRAVADFQQTAIEDGCGSALRTFARNYDFEYLTDGELPMNLDGANVYLDQHAAHGDWRESARARSRDSELLYTVGTLVDGKHHVSRPYVQIWQFDPKVVNWGLRVLLLGKPG